MSKKIKLVLVLMSLLITIGMYSCTRKESKANIDLKPTDENASAETGTPLEGPLTNDVDININAITLPPRVSNTFPTGGQEIGAGGKIQIRFDQAMDQNSTSKAFKVFNESGEEITGNISWKEQKELEFTPAKKYIAGEKYYVIVGTSAANLDKILLEEEFSFSFFAAKDLFISQVFPSEGTIDVESDAVITVVFNRPVVVLTTLTDQENLIQPVHFFPEINGHGEWINTSVYVFHPLNGLNSATEYTAVVDAGIVDTIGSELKDEYKWQFTTAVPTIANYGLWKPERIVNPSNYFENIRLESSFMIDFNQPMDRLSVENSFSLNNQNGESVSLNYGWNNDYQIIITPTGKLDLNSEYIFILDENAKSQTGGALDKGINWDFITLPLPGIERIDPENGSFQAAFSNRFGIYFKSPMNLDTLKEKVEFSPELGNDMSWYYNNWDWSLSFFGLEPSTDYIVKVLPGMEDVYGNEITDELTYTFSTAKRNPTAYFDLPYTPSIYTYGGEARFFISYVNVDNVDVKLYELSPSLFVGLENGTYNRWEFVPDDASIRNEWISENRNDTNIFTKEGLHLSDSRGNLLEPGIYFITISSPQVSTSRSYIDSRMIIVSEANITFKITQNESLVWLTDLITGKPLNGINLTIFDSDFKSIATGATDKNGILKADLPLPKEEFASRYVVTDDDELFGFAMSNWGSGVSPYDFGIWSDYYTPPEMPISYVYTDRPLYRTGQDVEFKGILRLNNDLDYGLLPWEYVEVEIASYSESVYKELLQVSEFGSFDGTFKLDENAALGYYSIQVREPLTDNNIGGVGFSVAEYKKPEFLLFAESNPNEVISGDNFEINLSAEYYSGGQVSNADLEWAIEATDYYFNPPPEYSSYTFFDLEQDTNINNNYFYSEREIVSNGKEKLDEDGEFILEIEAEISDKTRSQQYNFEATVLDITGTSVSQRTDVIVHKAEFYPGIKPNKYVGKVGENQSFNLVVLDWNGNPIPDLQASVEIVERKWYSVQEINEQGFLEWRTSVEEIPVSPIIKIVTDRYGKANANFVPENGGVYQARVTVTDKFRNSASSATYLWISSNRYISWQQTNDRTLKLVADKENYSPGETASVLITSPFVGENYALITVERGQIKEYEVILLKNNSTVYQIPITADMVPNVYLSVVIISGSDDTEKADFRMGMLELIVSAEEKLIQISIEASPEKASPGEEVVYIIKTTDNKGNPVSAEVSLALVDSSVLSLTEPNSPTMLEFFYGKQSLSVRTSIPLVYNIENYISTAGELISEGEGMGSGGGKGVDSFGVFDIRGNFQDTAFWKANLITDENGLASVKVILPDNLTIWHMDARAVTKNTTVGNASNDLQSTKLLIVSPQTPRFFINGDKSRLAAAVQNNTGEDLEVTASLTGEGIILKSNANKVVNIKTGSRILIAWDVEIKEDVERVDLIFSAKAGDYFDATKPTIGTLDNNGIPVYRYDAPETVGTSGVLTDAGVRTEGVMISPEWQAEAGWLNIDISNSLVSGIKDGLTYLKNYQFECIEQIISRFLANIITSATFKDFGISDPIKEQELNEQVNLAMQHLYSIQRPDGGWGWWSESETSDPLTSAYVVFGLIKAKDKGYEVNSEIISKGLDYLEENLLSLQRLDAPYLLNRQSFILFVLAEAGRPNVSMTISLYDIRLSLSLYARGFLSNALWIIDATDPRIKTIISDFNNNAIQSASGSHWEEEWSDYINWNNDIRTTSIILASLIEVDTENSLNVNAVRWLMSNRENGHWSTTQDTTWTLIALDKWINSADDIYPDYQWAVGLNDIRIGDGEAISTSFDQSFSYKIDISNLVQDGINRLVIGRDEGNGNLYYSANLNLFLPVDKIKATDNGILISRAYYENNNVNIPVDSAEKGTTLLGRLTIIVPNELHYVVITDPLPAGLEAVDQSLKTSPDITAPRKYDFNSMWNEGWGDWYFDHVELRDEEIVLSADYLPAGTYIYTYLVRASYPGEYYTIPPTAYEFYFPDVYGRGDGSIFTVGD